MRRVRLRRLPGLVAGCLYGGWLSGFLGSGVAHAATGVTGGVAVEMDYWLLFLQVALVQGAASAVGMIVGALGWLSKPKTPVTPTTSR